MDRYDRPMLYRTVADYDRMDREDAKRHGMHSCRTCAHFRAHSAGGMCTYSDTYAPDIDCPDDPTPCRQWSQRS
jgi:hypothetical protein